VLGAAVALFTWRVGVAPPGTGLDQSWIAGLYMSAHRGLDFGTQIAFTWGPLAFLRLPYLYYEGLAMLGLVYSAALYTALCVSLVWVCRRSFNTAVAVAISFVVLAALPAVSVTLVLATVWCLVAVGREPPGFSYRLVALGGGAFGAIECLVRLSSGPLILALAGVTLVGLARWRELATFAGTAVAVFVALWVAAGQGAGNLSDFARTSFELVSGYSQAMVFVAAPAWQVPAAVGVCVLLVACATLCAAGRRRRIVAGCVMALAAFSIFKEGMVRFEAAHVEFFFATATALLLALPWRRALWPLAAASVAGVGFLALQTSPSVAARQFEPLGHARSFLDAAEILVDRSTREAVAAQGRASMLSDYRLDPATLHLLRGRSVTILPWETAVAWAYGLDWDPLPVFQNYAAYTSYLDRLDSEALLAPTGPVRVLRMNPGPTDVPGLSVDARLPAWDPPQLSQTMLCNFTALRTTKRWQVLTRSSDRCGAPRLLRSVATEYGGTVQVPKVPGDRVVFARIAGAGVSGSERLRALLFRATPRYLVANGGAAYRLVPGTASDGLIMSVPRRDDLPGPPFRLSPDAHTISPQGASGPLTVSFYEMPIEPPPAPASPGGAPGSLPRVGSVSDQTSRARTSDASTMVRRAPRSSSR
jgi:hypothetical protein